MSQVGSGVGSDAGMPDIDSEVDMMENISELETAELPPEVEEAASQDESVEQAEEDAPDQVEIETASETDEAPAEADKPEEKPPTEVKSEKANQRFQALANRARQAEERAQGLEQRFQSMAQDFQQREVRYQEQMSSMQERLFSMMEQRERREFEASLSPEKRAELTWLDKAARASQKVLDPKVTALEQKLQELEQRDAARVQAEERQKSRVHWRSQAAAAVKTTILKDVPVEYDQEEMSDLVLTLGVAKGLAPAASAAKLKAFGEAYHKGKLSALTKKGQKIAGGQNPANQSDKKFTSNPTLEQLEKAGFKGPGARKLWIERGMKAIPT